MIGIISAMQAENLALAEKIENKKEEIISNIKFVSGTLFGKEVVVAVCGIGKVFAAICTEIMILKYNPRIIINTGVAGALEAGLKAGDIVISDSLVQHDMDTSALGDEVGLVSGINKVYFKADEQTAITLYNCTKNLGLRAVLGIIASGDQFIADKSKKDLIVSRFKASACEMEGASVAQVCYVNNVKFCIVRAISDSADGEAGMSYTEFLEMAAKNSISLTEEFIKIS